MFYYYVLGLSHVWLNDSYLILIIRSGQETIKKLNSMFGNIQFFISLCAPFTLSWSINFPSTCLGQLMWTYAWSSYSHSLKLITNLVEIFGRVGTIWSKVNIYEWLACRRRVFWCSSVYEYDWCTPMCTHRCMETDGVRVEFRSHLCFDIQPME